MLQFYFLSIVLNALAGYFLLTGDDEGVLEFKGNFSLKDETFRFVLGILTGLTGLFKILSPIENEAGNIIYVFGDLVPAVVGILAGFILIFEYFKNRATLDATDNTEKIDRVLIANKKIIGICALAAAVLHFLFPRVLLL